MKRIFLLLSFISFLMACEKTEHSTQTVFIAGLTLGECGGNCHHFFKLDQNELFTDNCDFCTVPEEILFQSNPISDEEKIQLMKDLKESVPTFLVFSEEKVFGCPDCGDWGAIHVILQDEGQLQHFVLDNNIEGNPPELQEFALLVRETIWQLNN